MSGVIRWMQQNPTRVAGIAAVVIGWLALVLPEAITTGLSTILGLLMGSVVWNAVTPVKKATPEEAPGD